jgi:hypothetical protein
MTAAHRAPTACFICGGGPHEPTELHRYWSNAEAEAEAAEIDRKAAAGGGPLWPSMTDVETLDPREAVY